MAPLSRIETEDGLEAQVTTTSSKLVPFVVTFADFQFAINHLGHMFLSCLLLNSRLSRTKLNGSAQQRDRMRIVNVTSMTHLVSDRLRCHPMCVENLMPCTTGRPDSPG
jgi:hypothetical protein